METIEFIRIASYAIDFLACIVLSIYFLRDFAKKRLRASLAWGLGFILFSLVVLNLLLLSAEITKTAVYFGFILSAAEVFCLYYGASLLFFREGSFFRERMAVIYSVVTLIIGWFLTYITPAEQILEKISTPSSLMYMVLYIVIALLFYQVSRRIPKEDPRKRTLALVAVSWVMIAYWALHMATIWLRYPLLDILAYLLSAFGFLLLLYGMTTGKTTR